MEKQLKRAKDKMLEGELANFEFTPAMKRNVLNAIEPKRKRTFEGKRIFPAMASAALVALFIGGMYEFVIVPNTGSSNPTPSAESPAHKKEPEQQEPAVVENEEKEVSVEEDTTTLPENQDIPPVEETVKDEENVVVEEPVEEERVKEDPIKEDEKTSVVQDQPKKESPTSVKAPNLMQLLVKFDKKFYSLLGDENIDFNFKFKHFSTKDEFFQEFNGFATSNVTRALFDHLLAEKPDGLYLLPQEGPLHYDHDKPYETIHIDEKKYQLVQHSNTSYFQGENYKLTVTFELIGGKWLITDITTEV